MDAIAAGCNFSLAAALPSGADIGGKVVIVCGLDFGRSEGVLDSGNTRVYALSEWVDVGPIDGIQVRHKIRDVFPSIWRGDSPCHHQRNMLPSI